ncbi:MAG: cyclic nucleotide-binding domain-containing protein [Pseudomonadota bacterium]
MQHSAVTSNKGYSSENDGVSSESSTITSVLDRIKDLDFFSDIDEDCIQNLKELASLRSYNAGETIAAADQFDGSEFLLLLCGNIDVATLDLHTGAMFLDQIVAPDTIGLAQSIADSLSADNETGLTLTASSEVTVAAIEVSSFLDLVKEEPCLSYSLMKSFARRLARRPRTIDPQVASDQRIFAILCEQVDYLDGHWRISPMPKHRDLAELAQVSEEEAAAAVAKLIRDGVASRDYPSLIVNDIEAMKRLAT